MITMLRLLELTALALGFLVIVTQLIAPAVSNEPLFPMFRKKYKQHARTQKRLDAIEQEIAIRALVEQRFSEIERKLDEERKLNEAEWPPTNEGEKTNETD